MIKLERPINLRDRSRQLRASERNLSGDYPPTLIGSSCASTRNSQDSIVLISASPTEKSRIQCPACSLLGRFGNSSAMAFSTSCDLAVWKEIAVSMASAIVGKTFVIPKNATRSRPFSERSKYYREKEDRSKNGSTFGNFDTNSSGRTSLNMAIVINRLSPGDAEKDAVLSPRDAKRPIVYHHVKKIYHHVILKIYSWPKKRCLGAALFLQGICDECWTHNPLFLQITLSVHRCKLFPIALLFSSRT